MKPPGYENLAYRRPPAYETSDGVGYPAEHRAAAAAELDDAPLRYDATSAGVFRTPDGVLHQHKNSQPPVTSCNCSQISAIRSGQRASWTGRGQIDRGRSARSAARLSAATRAMQDDWQTELQQLQIRTRMLELGA